MQLVEAQRPARSIPEELPPYFEFEGDVTDEVENQEQEKVAAQTKAETEEAPRPAPVETEASKDSPPVTQEDAVQDTSLDAGP